MTVNLTRYWVCAIVTALIVGLTSLWVGFDSRRYQIPSSNAPYTWRNGAVSWFVCCLLMWILVFPIYLFKRRGILKRRGFKTSSAEYVVGALAIVVVAFIALWPFLFGNRLSTPDLETQVRLSLGQTLQNNPKMRNVTVKSVKLVRREGNQYDGIAVIQIRGVEEQHEISVTYDGKIYQWKLN